MGGVAAGRDAVAGVGSGESNRRRRVGEWRIIHSAILFQLCGGWLAGWLAGWLKWKPVCV